DDLPAHVRLRRRAAGGSLGRRSRHPGRAREDVQGCVLLIIAGPLSWANTELVSGGSIHTVREMKRDRTSPMRTIGSVNLCRSLLQAGLVDRFRVVIFPVITGSTGSERIYDGYPDVALDMLNSRTFDGRIQLLEYAPRVLDGPPGTNARA